MQRLSRTFSTSSRQYARPAGDSDLAFPVSRNSIGYSFYRFRTEL